MNASNIVGRPYSQAVVTAHVCVRALAEKLADKTLAAIGGSAIGGCSLIHPADEDDPEENDLDVLGDIVSQFVRRGNLTASEKEQILSGTVFRTQDFVKIYKPWARDLAAFHVGKQPWDLFPSLCVLFLGAEVLLVIASRGKYQESPEARNNGRFQTDRPGFQHKTLAERLINLADLRSGPRKQALPVAPIFFQ